MAGVYTRYIYQLSGLFGYTYTSVLQVLAYIHIKVLAGGISGIDSSVYIIITYYNYIIVIYNIIVINNNNIIIIIITIMFILKCFINSPHTHTVHKACSLF